MDTCNYIKRYHFLNCYKATTANGAKLYGARATGLSPRYIMRGQRGAKLYGARVTGQSPPKWTGRAAGRGTILYAVIRRIF